VPIKWNIEPRTKSMSFARGSIGQKWFLEGKTSEDGKKEGFVKGSDELVYGESCLSGMRES
jgi:hypothetical protein